MDRVFMLLRVIEGLLKIIALYYHICLVGEPFPACFSKRARRAIGFGKRRLFVALCNPESLVYFLFRRVIEDLMKYFSRSFFHYSLHRPDGIGLSHRLGICIFPCF